MRTSELWCAVQCDPTLRRHVMGIYARNTLPSSIPWLLRARGVGFIVNTEPRQKRGRHWIAMVIEGNKAELFDSLAEPVNVDFDRYLKSRVASYIYNRQQLQSVDSDICGLYCLYYLLHKFKNSLSLNQIVHHFNPYDLLWNDDVVSRSMCRYFKYCTHCTSLSTNGCSS